jgi:hypothetical protein
LTLILKGFREVEGRNHCRNTGMQPEFRQMPKVVQSSLIAGTADGSAHPSASAGARGHKRHAQTRQILDFQAT